MSLNFLALILARGGSKGIPKKNIKLLNGKPLLAYTIQEAKKSKYIGRIVLSTEDKEIADAGKDYGAEVPFLRPVELATDDASSIDAVIHALNWHKANMGYLPEFTLLLQPTSPLRTVEDIDCAIEKILKNNAESLVSLCEASEHPFWLKKIVDGKVVPYIEQDIRITRRQDLPEVYSLNGAIYIAKSSLLMQHRSFYVGKTIPYIMPKKRSVDIDDMLDWYLAEALLKERG